MTGWNQLWIVPSVESWLQSSVVGGSLVDAVIAVTLLEVAVLLVFYYQKKRGLSPRDYLLNIVSGLCLMLALRCSMAGSAWFLIAAWLAAAGAAHVADIAMRLQQRAAVRQA